MVKKLGVFVVLIIFTVTSGLVWADRPQYRAYKRKNQLRQLKRQGYQQRANTNHQRYSSQRKNQATRFRIQNQRRNEGYQLNRNHEVLKQRQKQRNRDLEFQREQEYHRQQYWSGKNQQQRDFQTSRYIPMTRFQEDSQRDLLRYLTQQKLNIQRNQQRRDQQLGRRQQLQYKRNPERPNH